MKTAASAPERKSNPSKLYELTTPPEPYIYTFDAKLSHTLYTFCKKAQSNKAPDPLAFASHYTFATEKQARIAAAVLEERGYKISEITKEPFHDKNDGSAQFRIEESMYMLVDAKKSIPLKSAQN